jgi:hypothetical protein
MQSKLHSLLESLSNVAIGYLVAIGSQFLIYPLFDIHIPVQDNFAIAGLFTLISLARTYILRRLFNKKIVDNSEAKN